MTTTTSAGRAARDTCRHCPASAEACDSRRLFAGASCCSRCTHDPRKAVAA